MEKADLRQRIRAGDFRGNTSGLARGYVQANVVILPAEQAADFQRFCLLNPKPCPLLAVSEPGDPHLPTLGDCNLLTDVPAYRLFEHGKAAGEAHSLESIWQDDFVGFALGCSFSFEEALLDDGLEIRNVSERCNVPMYRTNIPCQVAGVFGADMVVSMRPFRAADAIRAIQICSRFPSVHGAPVHLGDPGQIGIADLARPDFGDPVT
ncbi:MAG: putative hydro-lyase, partial [Halioglobus sp.]